MRTADVVTTLVVLIVSFGFVVIRFKMLVRDRYDPRAIGMWLFGFTFAVALLFRIPYVYSLFDTWTGLNNLAWYISCIFFMLTVYVYVESCLSISRAEHTSPPRWITYGFLLTLLLITLTFWVYIRWTPEYYYPGQMVPADFGSWLIKTTMLSYALVIVMAPTRLYYRLYRTETILPTKIRWLVKVVINVISLLLFSSRLVIAIFGYLVNLPGLLLVGLSGFVEITQLLIMLWPLSFLPTRAYNSLVRAIVYLQKLLMLRYLLRLHRACQALPLPVSSPVLLNPLHKWDYIRHTDLCIYKIVIAILDYKRCLQDTAGGPNDGNLLQDLLDTRDDTGYEDQVRAYSQLGKSLT